MTGPSRGVPQFAGGAASLLQELMDAVAAGERVVLATVVDTCHSVPRHAGTKMLIYSDARCVGSIGGGTLEARVAAEALAALNEGRSRLVRYDLLDPEGGDPGACGGEMTVYLEPHVPAPTVLVVGCGHVGREVVELAHWAGFWVAATDDRPEMVAPAQLPDADVRLPGSVEDALRSFPVTPETHVVVTTRSTALDLAALPLLLATPARSVGVLGSRRRWDSTRAELLSRGVPADALDRVVNPVGLDIGAETPREIALAIVSEIIALRRRGQTGPTRVAALRRPGPGASAAPRTPEAGAAPVDES